jgi:hypothetical protein
MVAINVILVQSCRSRLTLLPVPGGHLELSLDVNADTALEGVRTYFFQRWRAEVHCLSWLFPEDFSLRANEEQLPFLVVCVDATGDLSLELVRDTACTAAHSDRSNGINPLLATATNPFPSEPWSFPDWLPHISEWIRGHFPQVRRISQVRCCLRIRLVEDFEPKDPWGSACVASGVSRHKHTHYRGHLWRTYR